ncbi:MAG: UbiA family prenyltransferase [Chitinispirillaceae bacterium]|nr:UbiA family prenyltransferase [Chitinispirillaceae bacterium]
MNSLLPFLKIARVNNVFMTGIAVGLGFWLGRSTLPMPAFFLLVIAGIASASFGNVINDLHDIGTDRISHRNRPLPKNELSIDSARIFAAYLAFTALLSVVFVSPAYVAWTALPLFVLALYTRLLKSVPLAGNIVISLLVGYAILYGALGAPALSNCAVPAALAFLLNLVREIIKDIQDEPGDRAAGIVTTAALPARHIRAIIYTAIAAFLILLFTPRLFGHFGDIYAVSCAAVVLPLQTLWLVVFTRKNWRLKLPLLSLLLKLEMAAGLLALAVDRLFSF